MKSRFSPLVVGSVVLAASLLGGCSAKSSVDWQSYRGMDLPVYAVAEKGSLGSSSEPVWKSFTRFEHTHVGASNAAIVVSAALDTADDGEFGDVLREGTVMDPGRALWAANRMGMHIKPGTTATDAPVPVGYLVDKEHSSDDDVHLTIYYQMKDESIAGVKRHMVWDKDRWRLQIPIVGKDTETQITAVSQLPKGTIEFAQKKK